MEKRPYGSPKRRGWVVLFVVITLVILSGGYAYYTLETERVRRQKHDEIAAIAKLKVGSIQEWRKGLLENVRALSSGPLWKRAVNEWFRDPTNDALLTVLRDRLVLEQQQGRYSNILLLDLNGNVIVSTSGQPDPINSIEKKAIEEAVASGSVALTDMYRTHQGVMLMDVVAPIMDPNGQPIAAELYRINPESVLFPLIQNWPTLSQTAETLLVRRDGDDALFLNDLRHRPNTALSLREPLTRHDLPASQAVSGKTGLFQGKDYRGEEVLADLRPVPDSPWFMVAKVDTSEILAEARYRGTVVIIFSGLFILLTVGITAYGYRNRQTSLYENLYQSEREQRKAEELFRTTLYSIGDAVLTTDTGGLVQQMNPVAERLTGWQEAEAKGKSLDEVFHIVEEESRKPVKNPVHQVLAEGLVVGLANHTIIISRDGAEFPIADSGAPIRSEDGSILGVVLVFRDQTEERAAQDALRASESFLNSVIEQSPYPMWISDHQGTLIKANKALRDLFQISDEEVVEKYNILNDNIVEEQGFMPLIKSVFERGDTARFELKYDTSRIKNVMLRHSTFVILEVTVFPIMDSDNKISNAVIQHMDITYRKREEQEKESLQAQLFQSQKLEALGTLVGGIAHDFNNMLQIILGYSQFLLDDKQKGEPGYKELQTIIETGKGGAELVKKLLAFGQQGQIFPVPLDLNHQISELTSLLSRTLPHSVQIDLDLTDGTTTILADHNQIDQVIMNLAINASEAMPNGGRLKIATKAVVSLDDDYCKTCHGAKSGSFVMLSVWDTGRGMDEETLAKVFDPFFSTKERGSIRGTGLGLSVVRGIVQQQGGHVTCESEPDKGTEFKVYFPAIETPVMSLKTVAPTVQSGGAETILVVDDNIPVAEFEQRVLENAGYQVILATKGKDALDIYQTRKNEISLVILDLLMPEMSGRDCLMELVNIDPAVKVLIASGYAPEDELHKEISPLVKGFVHKPFGVDELLNEVRLALDIES